MLNGMTHVCRAPYVSRLEHCKRKSYAARNCDKMERILYIDSTLSRCDNGQTMWLGVAAFDALVGAKLGRCVWYDHPEVLTTTNVVIVNAPDDVR